MTTNDTQNDTQNDARSTVSKSIVERGGRSGGSRPDNDGGTPASSPVTLAAQRSAPKERVTWNLVLRQLRSHNFAVLSTVDEDGKPASAGVNYGLLARRPEVVLYIMTRRHLRKARNIAANPRVSLVVPLPRPILQFVPPATIQLSGRAEILDRADPEGVEVFRSFWVGRRILAAYEESRRRGDTRACFLKITPDPVIRTYAVGYSAWDLRRRMESASARVHIPANHPGFTSEIGDARA